MVEREKIEQRPIDVMILGCLNIFGLGSAFTCLCRRYCKKDELSIPALPSPRQDTNQRDGVEGRPE